MKIVDSNEGFISSDVTNEVQPEELDNLSLEEATSEARNENSTNCDDDDTVTRRVVEPIEDEVKSFVDEEQQCQKHYLPTVDVPENKYFDGNDGSQYELNIERMPTYFQEMYAGLFEETDFNVPWNVVPEWLDVDKFKRGQKFAQEYLFSCMVAELLSLFMIFSVPYTLDGLIFTGMSHTPYKASRRYLSTLNRVISWYEGDFFGESADKGTARKNIAAVNYMHWSTDKQIRESSSDELKKRFTVGDEKETCIWATLKTSAFEDFRASCPVPAPGSFSPQYSNNKFNQLFMMYSQFAFVAFAVTFPKEFGIHRATDEELDDFVHLWRGIGFYLGMKDKYNFCNEGVKGVRQRTFDLINYMIKPSLRIASTDWEHMSRCLVEGVALYIPPVSFEAALRYVCEVTNIHTPRLNKWMTLSQTCAYYTLKFVLQVLCKIPGVAKFLTTLIKMAVKYATEAPPDILAKWKNTEFLYMKQSGKSPMHIS